MVGANVPHFLLLVNIVAPKLEDSSFLYPLLDRCSIKLADVVDHIKCGRVAGADVHMVESCIHLCNGEFLI